MALLPATGYRLPATGFTLVEMLVALAILSAIAAMVYGSYAAASRSLDLYHRRMACAERACLVLRLMARQLRCAYAPSSETGATRPAPQNRTAPPPPAAFRADPREADGQVLSFLTTGGLAAGPDQSMALARIRYRHDPSHRTLSIRSEPYGSRVEARQDPGGWRPILRNVTGVDLQFYDGRQWQPQWNSGVGGRLPQAVRIALAVADERGRGHEFGTTVPIACRFTPPSQTSVAGARKP